MCAFLPSTGVRSFGRSFSPAASRTYRPDRFQVVAKTTTYKAAAAPKFKDTVGAATVFDVNGSKGILAEIVEQQNRTTIITWLRHYGCTICRKQIAELTKLASEPVMKDVRVIAIGSGTAAQGKEFLKETAFGGEIFSDPARSTYEALKFTKGVLSTFNLPALSKLIDSFASGNKQRWDTVPTDPFQQGGCLVLDPNHNVLLLHRDEFAGDHVEPELLLKALDQANAPIPTK